MSFEDENNDDTLVIDIDRKFIGGRTKGKKGFKKQIERLRDIL